MDRHPRAVSEKGFWILFLEVKRRSTPYGKDRVTWTYEIPECSLDKEAWALHILCAPPSSKPARFEPVKGPEQLFRQNPDIAKESNGKGQGLAKIKSQQPEDSSETITVIDVENSQTDPGKSNTPDWFVAHQGWQIIDHGDCFFRAIIADSWHWTSKACEISAEKATTEGQSCSCPTCKSWVTGWVGRIRTCSPPLQYLAKPAHCFAKT